ncbi:MAG: hypothetical protein L6Q81_10420 [Bacteroidia bacterium]|nr:hypothetical protein [Bacteroidia bacterium]
MTKRDLFRILIKIFALYSLILGITYALPANISQIAYAAENGLGIAAILIACVTFTFFVLLLRLLTRKTDVIIDWFKLDQGYDANETTLTQFDTKFIFTISSAIIGGFLIVDYAPVLLNNFIDAFKQTQQFGELRDEFKTQWGINAARILVGYLLIKFAPKMHLLVSRKIENQKGPDSTAE